MGLISSLSSKVSSESNASTPNDPSHLISYNPVTEEALGTVLIHTREEILATIERARIAQSSWGRLPVATRSERMKRFLKILKENIDEVCTLLSQETGKPKAESLLTEVLVVIDHAAYFLKHAPSILSKKKIPLHLLRNRSSYVHYVPRGVVGIIAPWNFPWSIPMCEVIMALVAGNAVVLKPSEVTPLIAAKAKELFDASMLPKDLFQVVFGTGEAGAALLDSGIDYCLFTGSTETGRKVAAACGERLIPCTLELGGKTPALVCADADIERTARALVWGAFANSGQVCVSIERAYVHQAIYDELLKKILEEIKLLRQGNPLAQEVDLGSMTWSKQRSKVEACVRRAKEQGANVLVGGNTPEGPGLFYPPTVLVDCEQTMDVMREEIFGPVLPIMKINTEAQGITLCNDSPFGLMGYVFTKDTHRGKKLAEKITAGSVIVNDSLITFAAPETPWGGIGYSGMGRTHSHAGLQDLCQLRHVNVDRIQLKRELWWYPYRNKFYQAVKKFIRFWF